MNYPGIYRGIVTNTTDPEGKLRIKATVQQVLGAQECEWAWPCVPPGWPVVMANHVFTDNADVNTTETLSHTATSPVPKVGTGVWIMFEGGDREHPVWLGTWK